MNKEKIIVYTDGGARGNPGPAGIGVYIVDENGKELKSDSKYIGEKTNNFSEYEAVVLGFQNLKKMFGKRTTDLDIEFRLDSQLVERQLSGQYQIKEETLFPQFIKIWNFRVKEFPKVRFVHIPREENKKADKLANEAMDGGTKSLGI